MALSNMHGGGQTPFSNALNNFMQARQRKQTMELTRPAMAGDMNALNQLMAVNPQAGQQVGGMLRQRQQDEQMRQLRELQIMQAQRELQAAPRRDIRKVGESLVEVSPEGDVEELYTAKGTGMFEGTGMHAQAFNLIAQAANNPELQNTPQFQLAAQYVSRPQIIQTEEGAKEIPGMDISKIIEGRTPAIQAENQANTTARSATLIPGTEKEKKFNADQNTSYGFAGRMFKARQILEGLEEGGFEPAAFAETMAAEMTPLGLGNYLVTPEFQQYDQAKRNWVTANLRKESGAAIGVEEMEKEIEKYFPIPGDTKDTITQKAKARMDAEKAMINASGRKGEEIYSAFDREVVDAPADAIEMLRANNTPEMQEFFFEQFGYIPEGF